MTRRTSAFHALDIQQLKLKAALSLVRARSPCEQPEQEAKHHHGLLFNLTAEIEVSCTEDEKPNDHWRMPGYQ
jgi:hypothetical protein